MTRARDISNVITDANLGGTLDVSGAFTSPGIDDNADATALQITSSEDVVIKHGTNNAKLVFNDQSNSSNFFIQQIGSSGSPALRFFESTGDERMRIHNGGVLSVNQGIALGVGSNNTASNVLDDYEEGTFTPDVKNQSSSSTFSVRIGNYVKIGRLVLAHFYCDGGNTGTAGSNLVISGLPFTVDAGSGAVLIGNFASNGSGENNGGIHQNSGVIDGGSNITTQKSYFSANLIYRTS